MSRKLISSGSPFEKSIGFSRAVRQGNMVFVSGTAPIGEDGETIGANDAYKQTKRCLEISKRAIEDAEGNLHNTIRTRIYLKNARDWEKAAKAHGEFFSEIRPACTFVVVKGFIKKEWLVETEIDCMVE